MSIRLHHQKLAGVCKAELTSQAFRLSILGSISFSVLGLSCVVHLYWPIPERTDADPMLNETNELAFTPTNTFTHQRTAIRPNANCIHTYLHAHLFDSPD
ncbi:hypothetical protein T4B_15354 [Trichinella pseudospiralis]|uniref:Uncharacterized protein n=1 Tax=Trichinella pseudospiralis TaxID=6337 RepID=A0A0V1I2Q0_TRIPS|nr:hypothetical protein T4B_15354 [Trichinella pseudospiralis]KRZ41963.1 hypothetical protein T4C_3363 [Trichinella pseudospiralis]